MTGVPPEWTSTRFASEDTRLPDRTWQRCVRTRRMGPIRSKVGPRAKLPPVATCPPPEHAPPQAIPVMDGSSDEEMEEDEADFL